MTYTIRCRSNGEDVSPEEFERRLKTKRAKLGIKPGEGLAPGMFGDSGDWKRDIDQKRGITGARYSGQLARFPNDPKAFFTSKRQMLEEAKRRGMVEDND